MFGLDRTPNTWHSTVVPGLETLAIDRLRAALAQIGVIVLEPAGVTDAVQPDLVLDINGVQLAVEVKARSTVTPESVTRLGSGRSSRPGEVRLLVADRIVEAARTLLNETNWSWLDLRGHLHLSGPGVLVDTPVTPAEEPTPPIAPFAGKVALEIACSLLLEPDRPASVRELARELRHSPSSVSVALRGLRDAHLIDANDLPLIPDLFWEVQSAWRPATTVVGRIDTLTDPAVAGPLRTGWEAPETREGWALGDDVAAAVLGAPLGVKSGTPPVFYVPDRIVAHRAGIMLGTATSWDARAAEIRVAPVPQVCTRRLAPQGGSRFPLVHPVFAAIDLAADPTRGQEVVRGWTPEVGRRVW